MYFVFCVYGHFFAVVMYTKENKVTEKLWLNLIVSNKKKSRK